MIPIVHIEYRDVRRNPASLQRLKSTIAKYSLREWLFILGKLEALELRSPLEFIGLQYQRDLVEMLVRPPLKNEIHTCLVEAQKHAPTVVFSAPQVEILRKLALLHAPLNSETALVPYPIPEDAFLAFLEANELSDQVSDPASRKEAGALSREDCLEFLVRQFYLNHQSLVDHSIARFQRLFIEIPVAISRKGDYLDLGSEFRSLASVSLEEYFSVGWALIAPWFTHDPQDSSWRPWIKVDDFFSKATVGKDVVDRVTSLLVTPLARLQATMEEELSSSTGHWAYCSTAVRSSPFVEINDGLVANIGVQAALERITSGIYFLLLDRLDSGKKSTFRSFYGRLCQRHLYDHCEHYLGKAFQGERKYQGKAGKLNTPDGAIRDTDTLYLIDLKSPPLRVRTKVTGSLNELTRDSEGRRHGFLEAAEQLDRAITDFLGGLYKVFGEPASAFRAIVPIVITAEPLPDHQLVLGWIENLISVRGWLTQQSVCGVQIIDLETFERLLPMFRRDGVRNTMLTKAAFTYVHRIGYHDFVMRNGQGLRNELVRDTYERVASRSIKLLMGGKGIGPRGDETAQDESPT